MVRPDFLADLRSYSRESDAYSSERKYPSDIDELLTRSSSLCRDSILARINSYRREHPSSPLFEETSIFEPLGFERLETGVVSALAWLMDLRKPSQHGFERSAHQSIASALSPDGTDAPGVYHDYWVLREVPLSKRSRIDLAILYPGILKAILVEVKIDSQERYEQLDDYSEDAAKSPIFRRYQCSKALLAPAALKKSSDSQGSWTHVHWERLVPKLLLGIERTEGKPSHASAVSLVIAGLIRDVCGWKMSTGPEQVPDGNIFEIESALELLTNEHR